MKLEKGQKFSEKHGPDAQADPVIKEKINENVRQGELACAVAFKIAEELEVSPAEIGKTLDLLDLRLNKCQLGFVITSYSIHYTKLYDFQSSIFIFILSS